MSQQQQHLLHLLTGKPVQADQQIPTHTSSAPAASSQAPIQVSADQFPPGHAAPPFDPISFLLKGPNSNSTLQRTTFHTAPSANPSLNQSAALLSILQNHPQPPHPQQTPPDVSAQGTNSSLTLGLKQLLQVGTQQEPKPIETPTDESKTKPVLNFISPFSVLSQPSIESKLVPTEPLSVGGLEAKSTLPERKSSAFKLPPRKCNVSLSSLPVGEPLETQTITLVPTKVDQKNVSIIAVDQHYICYGVRGGKIRVIGQQHGTMALLKSNGSPVVHLAIQPVEGSDTFKSRLLSCFADNTFILWEMSQKSDSEVETRPMLTVLGDSRDNGGSLRFPFSRWNSIDPDRFILCGLTSDVFLVDISKLECAPDSLEGIILKEQESELEHIDGISKIEVDEGSIKDIAISQDGTLFIVATDLCLQMYSMGQNKPELLSTSILDNQKDIESLILCGSALDHPVYTGPTFAVATFHGHKAIRLVDLQTWQTLYEITFKLEDFVSSSVPFEQVVFDARLGALFITSSNRPLLASLHVILPVVSADEEAQNERFTAVDLFKGSIPSYLNVDTSRTAFENLIVYEIKDVILSLVATPVFDQSLPYRTSLYCVQSKSVQSYNFSEAQTCPSKSLLTSLESSSASSAPTSKTIGRKASNNNVHFGPESLILSSSKTSERGMDEIRDSSLDLKKKAEAESDKAGLKLSSSASASGLSSKGNGDSVEKMKTSNSTDIHTILKKPVSSNPGSSISSAASSMPNVSATSPRREDSPESVTSSFLSVDHPTGRLSPRSKRVSFSNLSLENALDGISPSSSDGEVAEAAETLANGAAHSRSRSLSPKRVQSPGRRLSPPPALTEDDRAKKASSEKLEMVTFGPVYLNGTSTPPLSTSLGGTSPPHQHGSVLTEGQYRSLVKELRLLESEREIHMQKTIENIIPSLIESAIRKEFVDFDVGTSLEKQLGKTIPIALEKIVAETLPKLIGKAKVVEAVSSAVASATKPAVESIFRDTFKTVFMPGMQKAVSAMFAQVHETLEKGLDEAFRKIAHGSKDGIPNSETTVKLAQEKLETSLDSLSAKMDTFYESDPVHRLLERYATEMNETIGKTIRLEMKRVLQQEFDSGILKKSASQTNQSNTSTPTTPHVAEVDLKAAIERDLELNDYESAFTKVLASSDLSTVLFLCSKISPKTLFSSTDGTLLSQPVILSLAHQISLDLRKSSMLKMNWIQECVMHLDVQDSLISEHATRILGLVLKRLEEFVQAMNVEASPSGPGHASIVRAAKVLVMVVKGVIGR